MKPRLPNLIIIGAAKAGTTGLYRYLREHPDIYMSPVKETNYFAYDGEVTKSWLGGNINNEFRYTTIDQYRQLFSGAAEQKVIGEASPLYLESTAAALRIRCTLPNVRLVASLRDPADRAFSAFMMKVINAREKWKMDQAFRSDDHYVRVGFYYEKMKRYYDLFPREQIKVVLFEDLRRKTLDVCSEIFEFGGVDRSFRPDTGSRHNVGSYPKNMWANLVLARTRNSKILRCVLPGKMISFGGKLWRSNLGEKPVMSEELRERLVGIYREDVLKLQDLIDHDLSAWLETHVDHDQET